MKIPALTMLCAAALAVQSPQAEACTRAVYLGPDGMTVTAVRWTGARTRSPISTSSRAGIERRGANSDNTVFWTSKYGSLSAAGYDIGVADGA